jgi:hypothetical protein
MGRFQFTDSRQRAGFKNGPRIHPIWSGIGFALMIIIPIISYYSTILLIELNKINHWVAIPGDLLASKGDIYLYIRIGATIVISLLIYLLFMLITFLSYRFFGPARYGPVDAPPIRGKARKRWK